MDGRTDTPSYRGASEHLKSTFCRNDIKSTRRVLGHLFVRTLIRSHFDRSALLASLAHIAALTRSLACSLAKFSPVSLHTIFTEYTKAFIMQRNAARQMFNVKKAVDFSFFCLWSLFCHFASFDACGAPNSRHFFCFLPQRDTFRQYIRSKIHYQLWDEIPYSGD